MGVTQPGTYTAQIAVNANTPQTINPIGVTMNVTPPKDWGKLAGTVTGTDCKGNTNPLQGAQVQANGKGYTFSLKTGKDGTYAFWAPTKSESVHGHRQQGRCTRHRPRQVKLKAGKTMTRQLRAAGSLLAVGVFRKGPARHQPGGPARRGET